MEKQMSRIDLDAMVNHEVRASRLARVEEQIAAHMSRAGEELVEVGRCLNEAKEQGLVPHGKWEAWVRERTGMSERTAQRWMQVAREIPAGSPIARLGAAKICALLTIAPAERETFAAQIGAETATSREVQAAVQAANREREQMKRERDEALRVTGSLKKRAQEAEEAARSSAEQAKRLRQEREAADDRLRDAGAELTRLRGELQEAHAQQAGSVSPEAQAKIDRLERELDDALEMFDQAQDKIAQLERHKGGAAQGEGMTLDAVRAAIGAFMATAGGLPQMLERQAVPENEAVVLRGQAAMIGEWAQRVLAAVRG